MTLTLRIENYDLLEDGGPAEFTVSERGFQAGRGAAMDWVLPDPSRHISSHHFDVAFVQGAYWLTDVSTNGTFLQGQRYRLEGPHKLTHGDRFQVGHYIVAVYLGSGVPMTGSGGFEADGNDPWSLGAPMYDPVDPMPGEGGQRLDDFGDDFIAHPAPSQQPFPGAGPPPQQPPPHAPLPGAVPAAPATTPQPAPSSEGPLPLARPQMPAPAAPPAGVSSAKIMQAFCEGAGIPPGAYAEADAEELAREVGRSLRATADEVMAMLRDRSAAKQFVRGGERTMRGATDNNPLKFLPDAEQALEALFLKPRTGYLTGADGMSEALSDVRRHQAAVFAAMQPALARLLADLAPEQIEANVSGGMLGQKKSRNWDAFVEVWDRMAKSYENGMLDIFLEHFAEAYARAADSKRQ